MKINIDLLNRMIDGGYIKSQKHPTLDLTIYNYTQNAQYENVWNEITLICRGLILDSEYNIIERPFRKFFNKEEHENAYLENIPDLSFDVFDKMDGSLGILYWDGDIPKIASRGSFTSQQAIKGTEILHKQIQKFFSNPFFFRKDKTYVFEIIYPENRIVVDYGDREELVLLGVIDTETGCDHNLSNYENIGFSVAERFDGIKDFEKLQALDIDNKEGFVVRFSNGIRMKIKFKEYCRLHRIITNVTSYDIWECLRVGTGFDEMLDKVPDEFYDWVKDCEHKLRSDFVNILASYNATFSMLMQKAITEKLSDKEFAEKAKEYKYPHLIFSLKNGKPVGDTIWKLVKPKYEKPFS